MDLMIDEFIDKGLYYKKISNDKVINITGEGGSGKTTLANEYRNDDRYLVVDYDQIILNPNVGTIEYELKQILVEKYGNTLFENINKIGIDKVKENFTTMYNEIINYLSNKNKIIVLDGTQLRFINDAKEIKGEFVALRPSLQTCVSQSVKRFIQNNPQATAEQIQEYTQKRTNILHQLNPMMNELLTQVDILPDVKDSKVSFDNAAIQNFLLEKTKKYLEIIKNEYDTFMSPEQIRFLNQLLITDCIEVDMNGKDYLRNQANEINNSPNMTSFEKLQELRKLSVPLAHGGRVFEDNKIHFYPSVLLSTSPNLPTNELMEKCDEVLLHELLHFFIRPERLDITNFPQLKGINNFTSEGLVDMCARDLQQKYGLFSNYNSEYGSNVIFVREALSNIPSLSERMQLIFNGSIQQIYEQTSTPTYNSQEQFIRARDKKTKYDEVITEISKICYSEKKEIESCQRFLYNFSANFESKEKALETIKDIAEQHFHDKRTLVEQACMTYQNNQLKNKSIEQIKIILDKISTNDDYRNPIKSSDFLKYINQDGYNITEMHQQMEEYLKEKLKDYEGRENEFQHDCLYEYAAYVIPMIKQDYASYLTPEAHTRLDNLTKEEKITLQEKEKGCAHTDGRIEIPYANPLKSTFVKEIRYSLDVLLHELFHQTHRFRVGENLYCKINGKENQSGMNFGGYLFEEGLTDKCTLDFARKHKLSCFPFFDYHIYSQLVEHVERNLNVTNGDLFNKDYREIFKKIDSTENVLDKYRFAELSRYTSATFKKKNSENKVEFEFNGKTYDTPEFPSLSEEFKKQNSSIKAEETNETLRNKTTGFDQRSESEIQIAEQIRIKNRAIAQQKQQQKQLEKPKTLVKTNENSSLTSKGYINGVILSLIVSGMLVMIIYFLFK